MLHDAIMDMEKAIGQFAIAIPIIHISTCAVYLAGYSAGFGSSVGMLFGPSDLFGLSVSELFWTYLAGIIMPLAIISPQFKPDYKTARTRADEIGDETIISRVKRTDIIIFRMIISFLSIFTILILFVTYIAVKFDHRIPYTELGNPLAFVSSFLTARYMSSFNTSRATNLILSSLLTFAVISFSTGLTRGQGERRYHAKNFTDSRPACGGWSILRTTGERYIAVASNNERAVLDADCRPVLRFPKRAPFASVTFAALTSRWWNGDRNTTKPGALR